MAANNSAPASKGDSPVGLPDGFDVNRPQRGARDGYFYNFLELNKGYLNATVNMQGSGYDPRMRRIIRHMIATVVDDNLKLYLWNLFDLMEQNIDNDSSVKAQDQRNNLKMDMGELILGEIWSYYDQFVGVTHRLKVGLATPPPGLEGDEPANMTEPAFTTFNLVNPKTKETPKDSDDQDLHSAYLQWLSEEELENE